MTKFQRPKGLIRYDQEHALAGAKSSLRPLRPRLIAYPLLLAGLLGALLVFGRSASRPEIILLRGAGAPYQLADERVQNQVRVKIQNRTREEASYRLELLGPPGAELIAPENPLRVAAGAHGTTSVFVVLPVSALTNGSRAVTLAVSDGHGFEARLPYRIIGPTKAGS
jgi:polyferredoxin